MDSLSAFGTRQGIGVLGRDFKEKAEFGGIRGQEALENISEASYVHAIKAGQGLPYGGRRAALKRRGAVYGQGASFGSETNVGYKLSVESETVGDLGRVSAEGLSEAFCRDARRYDTGFEPY